jgi:hypothetical protein
VPTPRCGPGSRPLVLRMFLTVFRDGGLIPTFLSSPSFDDGFSVLDESLYVMPSTGGALVDITPNASGFVRGVRWVSNTLGPAGP